MIHLLQAVPSSSFVDTMRPFGLKFLLLSAGTLAAWVVLVSALRRVSGRPLPLEEDGIAIARTNRPSRAGRLTNSSATPKEEQPITVSQPTTAVHSQNVQEERLRMQVPGWLTAIIATAAIVIGLGVGATLGRNATAQPDVRCADALSRRDHAQQALTVLPPGAGTEQAQVLANVQVTAARDDARKLMDAAGKDVDKFCK